MRTAPATALLLVVGVLAVTAAEPVLHSFRRIRLSDKFWAEGANFGDLNRDGVNDVIAGPYWYEGPDFQKRHELYPPTKTFRKKLPDGTETQIEGFEGALGVTNKYSDNFFVWIRDFNKDQWNDLLVVGFPGQDTAWFENPKGSNRHWTRHVVFEPTDNESPAFTDLTGDGLPELVCNSKGYYGYASPDWNNPARPWAFHAVSPNNNYGAFTHGMGVGDINGDGRADLLEKNGWWEQPPSLTGDPVWKFHKQFFGAGGSQIYAYDVNGDGRNDVITALAAHGFGLAWYEQLPRKQPQPEIAFREHMVMNSLPQENRYGLVFSELHAIDLVDMDGDGLKDIVTGKRYWSHGRMGAPDRDAAAVTYWFRLVRGRNKSVDWIPYLIDNDTGVGTQVVAGDLNGDGKPDVVVANKKGATVLLHEIHPVSKAEWTAAQPKPIPQPKPVRSFPALGTNGRPLNLDFENGSLKDWTATGKAFDQQPVEGDLVFRRRGDMRSQHRGQFWIGTYEAHGDAATGTLVSAPFKITHPYASFLVGGGAGPATRVEIVAGGGTGEVIFKTGGPDHENMRPVVADLSSHLGEKAVIRLVDEASTGWGHLNFDDFRFYDKRPEFANELKR